MNKAPHLLLMPPNWIGDVVMAQPAMAAIANHYRNQLGSEHITVCGRSWLSDLLPYLNIPGAQYEATIPAADTAYVFPNSFRSAWQCKKAGVKEIIGYQGQWRKLLLDRALPHRISLKHEHHRLSYLDIAGQMKFTTADTEVCLSTPDGDKEAGRTLMQQHGLNPERVICLAPGAQFGGAKCYPAEQYAEIAYGLVESGWQLLILGMKEDKQVGDLILQDLRGPHWNAAGTTSLAQALQLISACKMMLCNDSGLMHIAAGLAIPTVTPFGATDPSRTAPSGPAVKIIYQPAECSPCLKRECTVAGHPCMTNITSQMLLDACLSMLK
ncbi:heptosyltransferase II [Mariprofundus micogutta]|uniref:lipopolysaccharide heptosyltransferase II n=1 Tax=Mariprofundus micogutta TaxID=1921010 RepID=A0A1L8CN19_9PROT|nr:lipopolysaccharide heptosyltransferase II [Mariprofundus micogutta]GAV20294.1 heptosyltransferase II [Mariprofundus micogutta]